MQFPKTLTYYSSEKNDNEEYPDTCIYAWIESYLADLPSMLTRYVLSIINANNIMLISV